MTKLYYYNDGPESKAEKKARRDERQSAPSGWALALTAISIAFGVFFILLALLALYLHRYG